MAAPDVRAEFVCTTPTIQTTENYSSSGILPVDYLAGGTQEFTVVYRFPFIRVTQFELKYRN